MFRKLQIHFLILFYTLFCNVATDLVRVETPLIHFLPLGNVTTISGIYNDLPLVGKCCPENECLMKDQNGKVECINLGSPIPYEFSPFSYDFNSTGLLGVAKQRDEFVAVVGVPCKYKKYILSPSNFSEDEYYLLRNGSIYVPYKKPAMLKPGFDYCMEIIPEMGLQAFVCFNDDRKIATTMPIFAYGLLISVPFLILTIVAYVISPGLMDVHGKSLCCYCGCLAIAYTSLAFTQPGKAILSNHACLYIAFIIQFSLMACFFWLNVMCIEMWLLACHYVDHQRYQKINPKRLFFYYSLWGWGLPSLFIILSMAMDLNPIIPASYAKQDFSKECCSCQTENEAMLYFYVPIGILIVFNAILFTCTVVKLTRYQTFLTERRLETNEESNRLDQRLLQRLRKTVYICILVFFLMGLNWSMEVLSWIIGGQSLGWSAFDLINALQGVIIFGLFVLRKPERDCIWYRIRTIFGFKEPEPAMCLFMDIRLLTSIIDGSTTEQLMISSDEDPANGSAGWKVLKAEA